ncbi:MAG: ribbon-helix-helix domain-containing protein [Candidatus Acidiferrum sp.]
MRNLKELRRKEKALVVGDRGNKRWYYGGMKTKTSVTLSEDVLRQIDRLAGSKQSRSAFIERVLRRYLRERSKAALHARDLARINRAADQLNREASDILEYQASDFPAQED